MATAAAIDLTQTMYTQFDGDIPHDPSSFLNQLHSKLQQKYVHVEPNFMALKSFILGMLIHIHPSGVAASRNVKASFISIVEPSEIHYVEFQSRDGKQYSASYYMFLLHNERHVANVNPLMRAILEEALGRSNLPRMLAHEAVQNVSMCKYISIS